jgi:O-antigen/teichoic acid export membrane protein
VTLRSLARASALYTVGNFLPRVGGFILLPIYVRFLAREQFGAVALITSLSGLLAILYRLGLDGSLMRLHFDEHEDRQRALYSTLTALSFVSALVGSILAGVLIGPFFGQLFSGLAFSPFGILAIAIAAASAVSFAPAIFYRASAQAGKFLLYSLAAFLVGSVASVILVLLGAGAAGMLLGQLAGALVGVAVTVVLVGRIGGTRFDPSFIGPALRFGVPLTPHAVSAWVLRLADRWLIGLLIGLPTAAALAALGAYSLGYQLGYVITVVVSSFQAAWAPWFFRIGDRRDAPLLFSQMTTVVMAGLLALGVGVSALAPQIIAVIARPEYASAASVLPVVAMASVLYGLYTMLSTVVFYAKATGRLALITVSAAALNLFLNVILIPRVGIVGAAWATFGAYTFFALATWRYAGTVYPVQLDLRRLILLTLSAIATLVLAALSDLVGQAWAIGLLRLGLAAGFCLLAVVVALAPLRDLARASRQMGVVNAA